MGCEYFHYLIPKPNTFLPSAQELFDFINFLYEEKWVDVEGCGHMPHRLEMDGQREEFSYPVTLKQIKKWMEKDFLLSWYREDFSNDNVRFLFESVDQFNVGLKDMYYSIDLYFSKNYFSPFGECVGNVQGLCPSCFRDLTYDSELVQSCESRIYYECPSCKENLDLSRDPVDVYNCFNGEKSTVTGGTNFRFGLNIDCRESMPTEDVVLKKEFVTRCKRIFGKKFYQVADCLG